MLLLTPCSATHAIYVHLCSLVPGGGSHAPYLELNSKMIISALRAPILRILNVAMKTKVPCGANSHISKMAAMHILKITNCQHLY